MGRGLIPAIALVLAVLTLATRAEALEIKRLATTQGVVLSLSGEFVEGDANRVLAALSSEPAITVMSTNASPSPDVTTTVGVS